MSGTRQVTGGLIIALISTVLIGASLASALADNRLMLPFHTATPQPTPNFPDAAPGPLPTQQASITETPFPSATFPPPPTACMPPEGWAPYLVAAGDTLTSLAVSTGSTPEAIAAANCLDAGPLLPQSVLYLPALPATATSTLTLTPTPSSTPLAPSPTGISCGPPSGWITYVVQPGDTLYSLAQAFYTTVYQLQAANCLGSSTNIRAGDRLWVPAVSTRTPTPTASLTPSSTPTATSTPVASDTPLPTATSEPSPTQTWTSTPPPSETPPQPSPTSTPPATQPPPTSTPTLPAPTSTPPGTAAPH